MKTIRRTLFGMLAGLLLIGSLAAQLKWDVGKAIHRFTIEEISIDVSDQESLDHDYNIAYLQGNRIILTGTGELTIVDAAGGLVVLTLRDGRFQDNRGKR